LSKPLRPSYVEIDLASLFKNYQVFAKSELGRTFFCPMVKANAYGHGDVQVVQQLEKAGCKRFGVGLVEEGIRLRSKANSKAEIFVFGFTGDEAVRELLHHCLTPVVSDFSQLERLEKFSTNQTAIHLKINTGMNRLGFTVKDIKKLVEAVGHSKKLKVVGVGTHLMSSEDLADTQGHSRAQLHLFQNVLKELASLAPTYIHAYNSSGAAQAMQLDGLQKQYAYGLRIGFGLYGLLACDGTLQEKLSPVMSLKSKVVAVQSVKKGSAVSYGATWTAQRDSQIGIVPIGYADGVPTQLSNRGIVQVGEKNVPIVGRVCMDYTMIDITDCVNPLEQEVEFFGKNQMATQVAIKASTIGYDVLTRISERVPRLFVNEIV
jgi:alanine racemase